MTGGSSVLGAGVSVSILSGALPCGAATGGGSNGASILGGAADGAAGGLVSGWGRRSETSANSVAPASAAVTARSHRQAFRLILFFSV